MTIYILKSSIFKGHSIKNIIFLILIVTSYLFSSINYDKTIQNNLNYSLTSNGYSALNDINSNHVGSNILKPNELTQSVITSSNEYRGLDLNQGGFRQLNQNEIAVIDKHAVIFAKQLYGDNPTDFEIRDAKARLAQEALRGVDAEWSLILGNGKEYDEEARVFLSNYNGMFQPKDIYEFNDGTTDGTYRLTLMTDEEKQNIKDFTSQYAYILTSSGIEQQSVYGAYIPYHDDNMIDGATNTLKFASDLIDNPLGSLSQMGVSIYEGKVTDHIVGTVNGAITFGSLWLDSTLQQDIIDIYGQGQSGLGVQKFLHTGEALEASSYLFATVGARANAGGAGVKVESGVGGGSDVARVQGTIGDVRTVSTAEVNQESIAKGFYPPYGGNIAKEFTVTNQIEGEFVRVYAEGGNKNGGWLVRAKDIEGMSAQQIQQYLALPTVPNRIVDVTIPAGTNMRVGQIAEQPSFGATGKTGTQYQLLDKIEADNYINSRELK